MSEDEQSMGSQPTANSAGLDGHHNARAIIRLFQCEQCSYPLKDPLTLPCGNSLCAKCIPPLYRRENITYLPDAGRLEAFLCPFKDCTREHPRSDCSTDVTLRKLMDVVRNEVERYRAETGHTPLLLEEKLHMPTIRASSIDIMPRSRILHGGRLVSTYSFANMGELNYASDVVYSSISLEQDSYELLDDVVCRSLKQMTRTEFDCQICYGLFLDPITTNCGHTFCHRCITRVLDHSRLCPVCRSPLSLRPGIQTDLKNKRIISLLGVLHPDAMAQRTALAAEEESPYNNGMNTPLFVCLSSYPSMPTFLHVFEPRYRLMMRRALEGDRTFGMVAPNRNNRPQGQFGSTYFKQYGTLLRINSFEMLPDGRSLIEAVGVSRFKVLQFDMLDGYLVGRVERVDDISMTEEENAEARETTNPPAAAMADPLTQIDFLPTQQLFQLSIDFVSRGRASSAPWLHERVLSAYGRPPTEPELFPYWFASVLPISEEEKYHILPTRSVRERLKLCARWVRRLEAATARW